MSIIENIRVSSTRAIGVRRSEDLVMIQIAWHEGRTVEQRKALYKAIADGLAGKLGLRREDVFVNLVEVKKENWSFGNGVAQYAESKFSQIQQNRAKPGPNKSKENPWISFDFLGRIEPFQ
jgi:phenylpyruvate tautomerase PptA (4-oxalocrotonate tautomerase family)